jgi:MFS transporter, putative metabolite:H+ symporter
MGRTTTTTVEQAIELAGFGRFQRRLFVVCGVTWGADATGVLVLALALPLIAGDLHVEGTSRTLLVSAVLVGMLAGSLFWGPVANRIGRRRGFVVTVGIVPVFGVLSAFAPSVEWPARVRETLGAPLLDTIAEHRQGGRARSGTAPRVAPEGA